MNQINSGDELLLTELILENTLASYDPSEIVSLLSCFVFQEKTDAEPLLTPHLIEGRGIITEIADRVDRVQDHWKVGVSEGFGGKGVGKCHCYQHGLAREEHDDGCLGDELEGRDSSCLNEFWGFL